VRLLRALMLKMIQKACQYMHAGVNPNFSKGNSTLWHCNFSPAEGEDQNKRFITSLEGLLHYHNFVDCYAD